MPPWNQDSPRSKAEEQELLALEARSCADLAQLATTLCMQGLAPDPDGSPAGTSNPVTVSAGKVITSMCRATRDTPNLSGRYVRSLNGKLLLELPQTRSLLQLG